MWIPPKRASGCVSSMEHSSQASKPARKTKADCVTDERRLEFLQLPCPLCMYIVAVVDFIFVDSLRAAGRCKSRHLIINYPQNQDQVQIQIWSTWLQEMMPCNLSYFKFASGRTYSLLFMERVRPRGVGRRRCASGETDKAGLTLNSQRQKGQLQSPLHDHATCRNLKKSPKLIPHSCPTSLVGLVTGLVTACVWHTLQGSPKECFPGCENGLDKLRQKWKATAVTKFTKPGKHTFGDSCTAFTDTYQAYIASCTRSKIKLS